MEPYRRSRLLRDRRLQGVALGLLLFAAQAGAAGKLSPEQREQALASGRVSSSVVEALDREARVPVIVIFEAAAIGAGDSGPREFGPELRAAVRSRGDALLQALPAADFALRHRYQALSGMAGLVSARGLLALLENPDVRVGPDEAGRGHLVQALALAELDDAQAAGVSGAGITLAVIDSGVDKSHVDIGAAAVVAEQCFCSGSGGCCPGGASILSGAGAAVDDNGHGTNVTGIITSDGAVAPLGGAPDAEIVAVKVLDSNGGFCCSSDVIAALDWVIASQPDVDVVNMSLGTFATYTGDCDGVPGSPMLFAAAIDTLRAQGVLTTVSSGNAGLTTQMSAPACASGAISVGAVWDASLGSQTNFGCTDNPTAADLMTCWSNRNDRTDLFAPGALTTSTGLGGGTSTYRGTSQAAPLVAACAALLLEMDPGLTANQLEDALEGSPTLISDPLTALSYPRLDCADALARAGSQIVPFPSLAVALLGLLLLLGAPLLRRA